MHKKSLSRYHCLLVPSCSTFFLHERNIVNIHLF